VFFGKAELGLNTRDGETKGLPTGVEKQITEHGRQ
jgi:hypothetical protein